MKKLKTLFVLYCFAISAYGQNESDTLIEKGNKVAGDDPSQALEIFHSGG